MSRPARPFGGPLGSVVLLAVLASTAGWNAPPGRPVAAADVTTDVPVVTPERLLDATAARATAWDAAWDARAEASTPVLPVRLAAPGEPPDGGGPTEGARTDQGTPLGPTAEARAYKGRSHLWIPSLGMSNNVVLFPCARKRPPDNYMYRWGCAKQNNVYMLGHAYSVMKPLHDAYVSGRLHVGMIAIYADDRGRIRAYRVTEWRVVDPAEGVRWAIAAQPVPSMTLQTCVGPNDRWRLNVRLVAID